MFVRRLCRQTLDLLAPRSCVLCGVACVAAERHICSPCLDDLPWRSPVLTPSRGCLQLECALLDYRFPVDVAIKRFKFHRKLYYAPAFAEVLERALPLLPRDVDAVLPVPLHWMRRAKRGFNQAEELARPIAKQLGVPLLRGVTRRRRTPFQSGLGAVERARNLRGAFATSRVVSGNHILVVDDVITTGMTLQAIGELLLANGAVAVSGLCVARSGE